MGYPDVLGFNVWEGVNILKEKGYKYDITLLSSPNISQHTDNIYDSARILKIEKHNKNCIMLIVCNF